MSNRLFARIVRIAALVTVLAGYAAQASASDRRGDADRHRSSCLAKIVGTYLVTIRNTEGELASRSVVTLHDDGVMSAIDSAQGGGFQDAPFSAQLGSYACSGPRSATAITLDFAFTDVPDFARIDWRITVSHNGRGIAGEASLYIIFDALNADPFADGLVPLGEFTFEGVPVPAAVP